MPLQGKYEVKLGRSFLDKSQRSFMTMRCDFLPASVDRDKPGTIKISNDREVGVRLPNVPGAEPSSTLFKGNVRPVQKECLLIYNKVTGEVTLERISKAAQLKKIRDGPPLNKKPNDAAQQASSVAPPLPPNVPSLPLPVSSTLVAKPKVRTMSESSSDDDFQEILVSSNSAQQKYRSPPNQKLPPGTALNQTCNVSIPKRSTLSSSSSSSSSSSDSEIEVDKLSPSRISQQAQQFPRQSTGQLPQKPRRAIQTPSYSESLSEIDDNAGVKRKSLPSPPQSHQEPMDASSLQRDIVANDLILSETESEEDDDDN